MRVFQLRAAPVNTVALCKLCAVAGDALTKHLNAVLKALLVALAQQMHTDGQQQVIDTAVDVVST